MAAEVRTARKVISALFADVVGSTSLGEALDPEDFQEIVGSAVRRMIEPIGELGGTVAGVSGDGVLALFGVPATHEDDAQRAVEAGLRILDVIREYAREVSAGWGIDEFSVRVGIETGLAVVGPAEADPTRYDARGDALNTAARLQAEASAGELLVGPATHRFVARDFEWGEARELTLKGKAEPVSAIPALARHSAPVSDQAGARDRSPLIGRQRELDSISEAVAGLRAGDGGILFVTGEAGIGKSRLLSEARELAETGPSTAEATRWLEGRCISYGETVPYLPFREPVRECVHALKISGNPFLDLVAGQGGAPASGGVDSLSPEAVQHAIAEAFGGALQRLSESGAVALVLEDVHWADASSVALIERLVPLTARAPVLIALTARDERAGRLDSISGVVEKAGAPAWTIPLERLDGSGDRRFLAELVGAGTLPDDLERSLIDRAEGNPLFLEELVRSLIDTGTLVRAEAGWRVDRDAAIELPETVEKVLLARIDRLSADAREVIGAAAVVGRRFEKRVLATMLDAETEPIASRLAELERAQLIEQAGENGRHEHRFKHALIREAAYNSLLKRRRRELHLTAAVTIESLFGDDLEPHYALLARHYEIAGRAGQALDYHGRAAERAERVHAVHEALDHYTAALRAAESIDEAERPSLDRLRLRRGMLMQRTGRYHEAHAELELAREGVAGGEERLLELEILNELGFMMRAKDYDAAIDCHETALGIAREIRDPGAEARVLNRLSLLYSNGLKLDRALELAEDSLRLAQQAGDESVEARGIDALKLVAWQLGDFETLERTTEELIAIHRRSGDLWYLQWPLLERIHIPLAALHFEQALEWLEEGATLNRRIADAGPTRVLLHETQCAIHRARGELGAALSAAREASRAARGIRVDEWVGWAEANLGWTLLEMHAPLAAIEHIEEGLEAAERAGTRNPLTRCTAELALAHTLAGNREQGLTHLESAEDLLASITTPPGRSWLFGAPAYLCVARARLVRGEPATVEPLLAPILASARASGWQELIATLATSVAESRIARGDEEGAEALLIEALDACGTSLPAASWVAHATTTRLPTKRADGSAQEHLRQARGLVGHLAETIDDPLLRRTFLTGAEARLRE